MTLPFDRFKELLTSSKLSLENEGALVKLIEQYMKYREDRADQLPKLPEDDPENDSKFWDNLTEEEKKSREEKKKEKIEEETKLKEE